MAFNQVFRLPEVVGAAKIGGQAQEYPVETGSFRTKGLVIDMSDYMLGTVKVVFTQAMHIGGTEGPGQLEIKKGPGLFTERAVFEAVRRRRSIDPVADQLKI